MANNNVEDSLRKGLTSTPKFIPFWFLYDKEGSEIFGKAWRHNDYHYMNKSEISLIKDYVENILNQTQAPIKLVDIGCGNCDKTRLFIDAILKRQDRLDFVPVDIDGEFLLETSKKLVADYNSKLDVHPSVADWTDGIKQLSKVDGDKLVMWFGGLLNLPYPKQVQMLKSLSESISETDKFVLSMDVTQDPEKIKQAYLDPTGYMAPYYRNALHRLKRDYQSTIDIDKLQIDVAYTQRKGPNTCSYLTALARAKEEMTFDIPGLGISVHLDKDECINIADTGAESTCKYTVEQIESLMEAGQLHLEKIWIHENKHTALCLIAKKTSP